jgi:hypothetical protein
MSLKMDIVAKINEVSVKFVELSALVDQIVEPVDPSEQIALLTAQVAALQADVAAKEVVIADQAAKLTAANEIFKQGDALIEDPA